MVEAPVQTVFTALLTVGPIAEAHNNPAFTNAAAGSDGILRFQAPIGNPAYTVTVEVDQDQHTLAVQGHWWYRGVYTVSECPEGSLIQYRVHNVATRVRWAIPLMQRRLPDQMRRDLAALLQAIGRHLNCPAYPQSKAPGRSRPASGPGSPREQQPEA